jgi:lysine/ornithine N-monooxygenase
VAERLDVVVVGAGPFGLSVAANLPDRRVRVFGRPMETWRSHMPPDMLLRSAWEESSLSAPDGRGTLDAWRAATGERRQEPLPLPTFLRYSDWFRERFVPEVDGHDVARVERADGVYRITTMSGQEVDARSVVLAVGVAPFPHAPAPFREALGKRVTFAVDETDWSRFRDRRVAVVGGGQGALESASEAALAGAQVQLIVRSKVRWFADREPHHPRGPLGRRLYRLAYPAVGYGPPPFNRLALHPDLFAALPARARKLVARRMLRSGGSPWLRDRVVGAVQLTEGTAAEALEPAGDALAIRLSDGSRRTADHVVLATGYRFSLDRLTFLSPAVRARVAERGGWPVLDRHFRCSDPSLLFVGFAAEGRFGPVARFVLGTGFTAPRAAAAIRG